jgi:hypothetical protein
MTILFVPQPCSTPYEKEQYHIGLAKVGQYAYRRDLHSNLGLLDPMSSLGEQLIHFVDLAVQLNFEIGLLLALLYAPTYICRAGNL